MTDDLNAKGGKRKHGLHPYTTFTLDYLRMNGKLPWKVERLIPSKPFPKKVDLWNLFDLIYLDPVTLQTGYVQVTSWACRSDHKKKMLATADDPYSILRIILRQGNAHADLYSWRKENCRWDVCVERVVKVGVDLSDDGERIMHTLKPAPLTFEPVPVPSMAASREKVREASRETKPPKVRRIIRRVPPVLPFPEGEGESRSEFERDRFGTAGPFKQ